MGSIELFSLKSRSTFFLLVFVLSIFSIGSWWSVHTLIRSEVKARILANADRIETALRDRFDSQGNNLVQVRAHLSKGGVPSPSEFKEVIDQVAPLIRSQGARGVGFAEVVTHSNLRAFQARMNRAVPGFSVASSRAREIYAPITMLEPSDWRDRATLGHDFLNEPEKLAAIEAAAHSGETALALPLGSQGSKSNFFRDGFLLFLPIYKHGNSATAAGAAKNLNGLRGVLYSPINFKEFFGLIFGEPNLSEEQVNFEITAAQTGQLIYNRFGLEVNKAQAWPLVDRSIELHGLKLNLRVHPLPHFFSFSDRFLALIVGLGAALSACLVLIVLKVGQNQLEFETLAKESSIEAAKLSRRQVESLRRLNDFDRTLAGELELNSLVQKFSEALGRIGEVDSSFIFFKEAPTSPVLQLSGHTGMAEEEFLSSTLSVATLERMSTQSLMLRKGEVRAGAVLTTVTRHPERFSDWILTAISTREGGRCGLVFAARRAGRVFSEVDRELLESMISQFASGVEIAQLFARVEDASKAKNAFLANMSHEIRTPLSAIVGFSGMLAKENLPSEQRESLVDSLRRNGEQLTCIIDDILDLSKIEAGKLKVERAEVPLSAVLQEVISVMELRARAKGIDFSVEAAGLVPSRIHTDPVRLKQILMNLAGNAIKFTEKGSVRLLVRYLRGKSSADCLAFTIKDTGIGIGDEFQGDLFRPFSQGDVSNTRQFGGTGLGLALSKRLAQELGGDVMLLESIRDQGSTFEVRISVGALDGVNWIDSFFPKAVPLGPPPPKNESVLRLDGVRILVVEDAEDNQEIFRYFLESSGAQAKIVNNGLSAVQTAGAENFDMILMDIQIPGIDGKEATRRIRRQGFSKPIVALTAHAMPEEQESCFQAGCTGQITKPVTGEALIAQVAEFLRRA